MRLLIRRTDIAEQVNSANFWERNMASSSAKKSFLKGLPVKIKYASLTSYRIPSNIYQRIVRFHDGERNTNCCKDVRDFVTHLALEGLKQVQSGNENLMACAVDHSLNCNAQINIDYSVIGYRELKSFNDYVNGNHIKNVQQAVSFCVICGYISMLGSVKCPNPRTSMPIYS